MAALISQKDQKVETANDELQQCDLKIKQLHTDLECALQRGDQYDLELKSLKGRDELLKERDDRLKEREAQVKDRDVRIAKMASEISSLKAQLKQAQEEFSSTAGSMSAARAEFDKQRDQLHDENEAAKAQLANIQRKMTAANAFMRAQWDSDRALMVEQHKAELAKAQAESASEASKAAILGAQATAEAAVNALRAQLADVEQACTKAEGERDGLRASLSEAQAATKTLEEGGAAELKKAQDLNAELTRKIATMTASVAGLTADKEGLAATIKGLRDQLAGLQSELSGLNKAIAAEKQSKASATGELAETLQGLKDAHATELAGQATTVAALNGELKSLREEAADLRTAHARALLDIKLAEDSAAAKQTELDAAKRELASMHENKLEELMAAHADGVQVLERELAAIKSQQAADVATLTAAHAKELAELRASTEDELASAAFEHKKALMAAQDGGKKLLEAARAEWAKQASAAQAAMKDDHTAQLAKQAATFAEQLERRLAQESASSKKKHEEDQTTYSVQVAALTKEQAAHQEELASTKALVAEANGRIALLEADVQSNRSELEQKGKELLTCRSEGLKQLEAREEELRAHQQSQMEALVQSYRDQFAKAKEEAGATQNALELKINIFKEELENAQDRFRKRAPRDEDVARIRDLEQRLSATMARMTELQGKLDLYVLEVQHQDQASTRFFKPAPAVGALNPLVANTKGKASPRRASRASAS